MSNQKDITKSEWLGISRVRNLSENISRCMPFFKELGLIEKGERMYSYKLTDNFLQLGKAIQEEDEVNERRIWRSIIENNLFFNNVIKKIHFTQGITGFMDVRELKEEIIKIADKEKQSRTNKQYFDAYALAIINLLRHIKIIKNINKYKLILYAESALGDESNDIPPEIKLSLKKFREDYPDTRKTAFIIMQFGKTPAHKNIVEAISKFAINMAFLRLEQTTKNITTVCLAMS